MFDFKKYSEKGGFYLGIAAIILLGLAGIDILLLMMLFLVTFGAVDNPGPILNFLFNFPRASLTIGFYLSVASILLLICSIFFDKTKSKKKILFKIIPGAIVISIYIAVGLFVFFHEKRVEKDYQNYLAESIQRPFSCDKNVCENMSFSKEENVLSFTLINDEKQSITLTSLYETGSCLGGQLQEIKGDGAFPVILETKESAPVKIKCAGVSPDPTGFFAGQIGFKFNMGNESDLNFHVYYLGPRLK